MRYRLVDLETWPESEAERLALEAFALGGIEGPFDANVAKKIAELGGRGRCILEDQTGSRSMWRLSAVTLHYAYPEDTP